MNLVAVPEKQQIEGNPVAFLYSSNQLLVGVGGQICSPAVKFEPKDRYSAR